MENVVKITPKTVFVECPYIARKVNGRCRYPRGYFVIPGRADYLSRRIYTWDIAQPKPPKTVDTDACAKFVLKTTGTCARYAHSRVVNTAIPRSKSLPRLIYCESVAANDAQAADIMFWGDDGNNIVILGWYNWVTNTRYFRDIDKTLVGHSWINRIVRLYQSQSRKRRKRCIKLSYSYR